MGMPPAKLGLIYSHTGLAKFIDVCGPANTAELFFVGRNVDSDRAREMGLVNEVVEPHALDERVLDLAAEIASNAPLSLAGNKRMIRELRALRLPEELARELVELRESCFALRGLPRGRSGLHGEAQAGLARALGPDDPEAELPRARASGKRVHGHDAGAIAAGAERPALEAAGEARGLAARVLLCPERSDAAVPRPVADAHPALDRDRHARRLGQRVTERRAALRLTPSGGGASGRWARRRSWSSRSG